MAVLSKHGRELMRVRKSLADKPATAEWDSPLTDRSITRAYMSDGKVLEKYQVRFNPSQVSLQGSYGDRAYLHDWGWKVIGTWNKSHTIEQVRLSYAAKGWEIIA